MHSRLRPHMMLAVALVFSVHHINASPINPAKHILIATPVDTCFVFICTALVMLMTPALALFYGGLVRSKNVLSVLMQCLGSAGVVTVLWVALGYSLAFSPSVISYGKYGLVGGLSWAFNGISNVGLAPRQGYGGTIPHELFMIYECMFAMIAPALIAGAFAERMKFAPYLIFSSVWLLLVYCPVAHWVWSEHGWLHELGALDFAGGAVVHMTTGWSALVMAIVIRPRHGFPRQPLVPHNIVTSTIGAGLLWFGWFGFNGGSALASGPAAVVALIATHCAAAAGSLAWICYDWIKRGRPTTLGAASGAISGLVAITPACGYVGPGAACLIGVIGGCICAWAVEFRAHMGVDDSLDAFGIHGVGGLIGALLTGVFATAAVNPAVSSTMQGLVAGQIHLLGVQLFSCGVTILYASCMTLIIALILNRVMGLRASSDDEQFGLDLTQHGESAYNG